MVSYDYKNVPIYFCDIDIDLLSYFISVEKNMNELFTFNSHQLQSLIKRPSSTDNPPNIRKRILTSKFCKKQSLLSSASTKEDMLVQQISRKKDTERKVTFFMDSPSFCEDGPLTHNPSIPQHTKSLNQKEIRQRLESKIDELRQTPRYHLENSQKEKGIQFQLGKRSLSTAQSRRPQTKREELTEVVKDRVREKRLFSLRMSPKIVSINDKKLPKAFKIKYFAAESNLPKIDKKSIKQERKSREDVPQMKENKNKGISQLQKLLQIEAKFFQKLYRP